ncbi:MAG: TIGR00282 family metallophosphoesterase [Oscillospiraceae bacterium]|nr:TIGR00282 family metallophosphoesterase [Oscillospiraceae bacterium]
MNILAIGDVVGSAGCEHVRRHLAPLKKLKGIDICIVNGENSSDGNGITPVSAQNLLDSGADVITTGNHVYKRREIYEYLDGPSSVIRPANYVENNPGQGYYIVDKGSVRAAVINLAGTMHMEPVQNPFYCVDKLLEKDDIRDCKIKIVDFHAETTSEKRAMGFYLAGRVSAVFGTHTHVQTADEQIIKDSTGYITDIGMTGPIQSVLGVKSHIIIEKLKTNMPARFENEKGDCFMCGCIFEIDNGTGHTLSVERIDIR